jgi:hypothetical protein
MIWVVDGKAAVTVEAWGGVAAVHGVRYDTMKPRRTTPGRYVIHSCAPYHTDRWELSQIPWGARLQVDPDTQKVMYETGIASRPWRPVTDLIMNATKDELATLYRDWFGGSDRYDDGHDGVPDRWVFNDFGPWAVRYFVDENHDGRLDAGESLSGEMIHTTAQNEGEAARGVPVKLDSSHGCIHVSPASRDRLWAAGAFAPGTALIIHRYTEAIPLALR